MAIDTASSSSSAACPPKKYDVFISFRGEDTRSNFTSHLHDAFCRNQILTYIDNRLHRGDEISSALIQAIQDSYVSVVVFSENYATSRWCLDELTKILQCKRDQGQLVIPVFYKVEPTHVRHQTGPYEKAFEEHDRKLMHNQQNIYKWKAALTEAASLVGWDSHTFRDESELVQNIAKDVLQKLKHRYLITELKGLVSINNICAKIELLLESFQTIGIWGMGGIGKTTIAKSIFIKYASQYEGCCFLENVRENSGKHENGLYDLHYKLVSNLLENGDLNVGTSVMEFPFVEFRLVRKKVFIVLDDVSSLKQLEYLIGGHLCIAPESKIIITTRDKHVLSKGVDVIYKVNEWKFQDSYVLFNLNAFNQSLPLKGYEELSKRVVNYAKGIPLALKVIGSFLHAKSEDEWDSALRKLEKIPNQEIQSILRLSYDGLDDKEKEIFLEIACFFKGKNKEHVISLLDSYGLYAKIGMRILQDKALIIVGQYYVWMHDLIQKMGYKIARQECIKELGQHCRLWDPKEAYDILANNKGTDKIEGIMIDVSQFKELCLSDNTFKKMPNVRYLNIYSTSIERSCNMLLPNGLESFSNKIRYLEWVRYPLKTLPSTFGPEKLVELHMPKSHIKKLWDGAQDLVNLKGINLENSYQLMELPDLSKASSLKWAIFKWCINLQNIHPSILSLHFLNSLDLEGCVKIETLKSEIHLKSLSKLELLCCLSLKEFSVSSEKIKTLDLHHSKIEILHSSIGHSSQLLDLSLHGSRLQKIPEQLSCLGSLKCFSVYDCVAVDNLMLHILFDGLRSLTEVRLYSCCNFTELPNNIQHLSSLELLSLRKCKKLRSLPKLPPSIEYLDADDCTSLETMFPLTTFIQMSDHRYISFLNCMKLDEQSIHSIMEDTCSFMRPARFGNKFEMREKYQVLLLGSKALEWFRYRTKEASITMELPPPSNLLGFLVCLILEGFPSSEMFRHRNQILCDCYLGDSTYVGTIYIHDWDMKIPELNSDHVFLWYSQRLSEHILTRIKEVTNDEFVLTIKFSYEDLKRRGTGMKVCSPISVSDYEDFKRAMQLERNKKRPRDDAEPDLQQQLLPHFKKLKLDLDTQAQTNAKQHPSTYQGVDELESVLMRISIT